MKHCYSLLLYFADDNGEIIPIEVTKSNVASLMNANSSLTGIWNDLIEKLHHIIENPENKLTEKIKLYSNQLQVKEQEKIIILFVSTKALISQSFYRAFFYGPIRELSSERQQALQKSHWPVISIGQVDIMSQGISKKLPEEKEDTYPVGLDPRFRFLDSGIWHRYVAYSHDFKNNIVNALKHAIEISDLGVYKSIAALSSLEFQCRMLVHSFITSQDYKLVTPFHFHSENQFEKSAKAIVELVATKNLFSRELLFLVGSKSESIPHSNDVSKRLPLKIKLLVDYLSELNFEEQTKASLSLSNSPKIKYRLHIFNSIDQGITLLKNQKYDLILIDYTLGFDEKKGSLSYAHEFLLEILKSRDLNSFNVSKYRIFPISSLPYSLSDKIGQLGIEGNFSILTGGDPLTTPSLFVYNFLIFILHLIIPSEIIKKGIDEIRNYLERLEEQGKSRLFEAKALIIGEPGVGKTTLVRKLINPLSPMPNDDESTKGISINKFYFNTRYGEKFKANIWDFAGQEIYKATHQFFLTQRSLYVLVADVRCEEPELNYWLQTVETFGKGSPLLIVFNEKSDLDQPQYNESAIKGRFNNFKESIRVNLKSNNGLRLMNEKIQHYLESLSHIGDYLPKQWTTIKSKISELSEKEPYISKSMFNQICQDIGINDSLTQKTLSGYFHDIGICLHFRNDYLLERFLFLQESWITNAVYNLLDAPLIKSQNGLFNVSQLGDIWNDERYSDTLPELLRLMMNFELCYQIPNSQPESYIVPQLLVRNKPEYDWNIEYKPEIYLRYQYDFIPVSIMTKLIVRLHHFIENQLFVWKDGMVLNNGEDRAEVIVTYNDRIIQIRAYGVEPRKILSKISDEVDLINDLFPRHSVEKLVPCICAECLHNPLLKHFFKYATIKRALTKGKETIECRNSFDNVPIRALFNAVFFNEKEIFTGIPIAPAGTKYKKGASLKIFVLYAHQDISALERLKSALSLQIKTGKIDFWFDHMILPGSVWQKEIEERLKTSDIILLLLSPYFWASKFIWEIELPMVEKLYYSGQSKVLPILYSPNDWGDTIWSKVQATPRTEKGDLLPISEWNSEDNAWQTVSEAIKKMLGD